VYGKDGWKSLHNLYAFYVLGRRRGKDFIVDMAYVFYALAID